MWFVMELAGAATFAVGTDAYPTLDDALSASGSGDEITLPVGTFEAGVKIEHSLSLTGAGPLTILVPGAFDEHVLDIRDAGTVRVSDLTIDAHGAQGLHVGNSDVVITGVTVRGGVADDGDGGNVDVFHASITATDCHFTGGYATDKGANVDLSNATATFTRVFIRDGRSDGEGGGLFVDVDSSLECTDCVFTGNVAVAAGGGLYASGPVEVTGGLVMENSAGSGGGAQVVGATFTGTTFVANEAHDVGGALWARGAVVVDGVRFLHNDAYRGGAISGGGSLHAVDSVFLHNESRSQGGAIYLSRDDHEVTLRRNLLCANEASEGAVFIGGGVGDITNNVFAFNAATLQAADFSNTPTPNPGLANNTFVSPDSTGKALGVEVESTAYFHNNIAAFGLGSGASDAVFDTDHGYPLPPASHNVDFHNRDMLFPYAPSGPILTDDPLFVHHTDDDRCNDDFRLSPQSLLVDAGKPDLFDVDGSRSDPGAHGGPDAWATEDEDGDGWALPYDCDDSRSDVHPQGVEVAGNDVDEDCDHQVLCYADGDSDGFGFGEPTATFDCTPGSGFVAVDGDCDDSLPEVFPGAPGQDCGTTEEMPTAPVVGPGLWYCGTVRGSRLPWTLAGLGLFPRR